MNKNFTNAIFIVAQISLLYIQATKITISVVTNNFRSLDHVILKLILILIYFLNIIIYINIIDIRESIFAHYINIIFNKLFNLEIISFICLFIITFYFILVDLF